MPDVDDVQDGKDYHIGVPMQANAFFLRGSNSLDWGMKNRLARIFNPATGKTVMLAVDHGYFQGPTTGLERIDLAIVPLVPYADALMITRGALRTSIPPEMSKPVVLRSSGGQSILKELSNELVAVDIDDAVRLNASAMAVQVYIGGEHEHQSIGNMVKVVDAGNEGRHSHAGGHRGGQGTGARCQVSGAGDAHLRRNGRARGEDLLLREGICARCRCVPGSAGDCGWQEAAGTGCPARWRTKPSTKAHRVWTWAATFSSATRRSP